MTLSTELPHNMNSSNIVIVDDNPDNLRVISATLQKEGYNVRPVTGGKEALAVIGKQPPDLILLDIRMPEMDGFELCRILKSDEKTRDIPVIFISAVHETEEKVRAFNAGGVDYITKPLHHDEIVVRVKTQIVNRRVQKEITQLNQELEERVNLRTQELETSNKKLRNEIAQRKRVEAELKESEEHFRFLFEHAPDMYVILKDDGTIMECSLAVERIFGVHRDELRGKKFYELDTPESFDLAYSKSIFENILRGDNTGQYEYTLELDNIPPICTECTYFKVTMKGERCFLVIVRDITAKKNEEKEKKNLEKQLFQAQKMEAIGMLAGGIAHDFNNILAAVFGYTQLAQDAAPEDSLLAGHLRQIMKAGHRAKELIAQILALSKPNEYDRIPCDISLPIREALGLFKASLPASIEIRGNVEKGMGLVSANPTAIHQVVMNLCMNAFHAIGDDEGTIAVALSSVELDETGGANYGSVEPGRYLLLSVTDNGCGMDEKTITQIFDPYFTTKDPGVGTGLGLSTVHNIVKEHNGGILVESELNAGTTVKIVFPCNKAGSEAITAPVVEIPTGNERILYVEDEQLLAEAISEMMASLGYKVDMRTDPVVALEAFRADPKGYDLVITDMRMPKMNGLKLAGAMMKYRSDIPIMICTGFKPPELDDEKSRTMIKKILIKPILLYDLASSIREVLDR